MWRNEKEEEDLPKGYQGSEQCYLELVKLPPTHDGNTQESSIFSYL